MRTQNLLKKGFLELLLNKPVQQISVKELTEHVNLNRGTFYLHYTDIYDLLDQIENEMMENFRSILESYKPSDMQGKPFSLLKDIFKFLGENADFCRMVLGDNREQHFINKLKDILKEKCFADWEYVFPDNDPETYEAFYAFILSGCIGMIENWLFGGMKQSAEEVAALTGNIILNGAGVLKKQNIGRDSGKTEH